MGAVPDGCVEFQLGGDPGVIIPLLEFPVALQQRLQPHQVRELPGPGCLAWRLPPRAGCACQCKAVLTTFREARRREAGIR
jgi:hypothetical protein